MKKNLKKMSVALATFCGVILAMAVTFTSCKKDDDKAPMVKKSQGTSVNAGFDKGATYLCKYDETTPSSTVTHVYGIPVGGDAAHVNDYHVKAVDGPTSGAMYGSFCAYSKSEALGGDTYLYYDKTNVRFAGEEAGKRLQLINAFDYIVATHGNITTWLAFAGGQPWGEEYTGQFYNKEEWEVPTKYIAQLVTWRMLEDDGVIPENVKSRGPQGYNEDIFNYIDGVIDAAWQAGLNPNYQNTGNVTDLVFLADESYQFGQPNLSCQPQIVPLGETPETYDECIEFNPGFKPNATYNTRGNGEDGWDAVQDFIPGSHHTTYNFWLTTNGTDRYTSFCGNYGSSGIGKVSKTVTMDPSKKTAIVAVLDYIYNKYGSIVEWSGYYGNITNNDPAANTKLIAQYAIWQILGGDIVTCGVAAIDQAVTDALANGKVAMGLIDIYYMGGANYPNDIEGVQPQIVPVCHKDTPPPVLGPAYGSVTATQKGNVPNIIASLNPKNGNPQDPQSFNAGVVYGSNHFCYATFTRAELEAGVKLDFVVGNKFQIVGTGSAKIVGGNIEVTIDNFGKGDFGVMAFNQNMVAKKFPKNGNIHSQKEADLKKELGATTGFNHDNKLVVPCPSGNTIYLYIHCGSVQFFL